MGNKTSGYTLFKSRTTGAVVKAGYSLYMDNFRAVFKASWALSLVYAMLFSALFTLVTVYMPQQYISMLTDIGEDHVRSYMILMLAVALVMVVGGLAEIVFYSCGMSLLANHSATGIIARPSSWLAFDKHMAFRTLKGGLSVILLLLLPAVLFALFFYHRFYSALLDPSGHVAMIAITTLAVLAVAVLTLPLSYVAMRYVFCSNTHFWKLLPEAYIVGLRHLAHLLAVTFVVMLIAAIAGCVILLPANILYIANIQANFGLALGDPLGMPDNMPVIAAATFFVAGFLQAYIRMSVIFPLYFAYGSITVQEEDRLKYGRMADKPADDVSAGAMPGKDFDNGKL